MYQIQGYPQRMKVYWIPEKLPILDDLAKDKTYLQPEESNNVKKNIFTTRGIQECKKKG